MMVYLKNKFSPFFFVLVGILLAACQSSTPVPGPEFTTLTADLPPTRTQTPLPAKTTRSTPTPAIERVPTDTPDEIAQNCCAEYRIGLLGMPVTFNYWRYLGEGRDIWTGYVIGDEAPSLYEVPALRSVDRLDFVPALAADLPPKAEQRDELWVIPVDLIGTALWSDGEPLTAHDVAFTVQTVIDLRLGGHWVDYYSAESLAAVEAPDDLTVEFYFYEEPGLAQWQFAAAIGPILPMHFWEPYVGEALRYIEGVEPPETCLGDLALAALSTCQAYASARQALYEIEPAAAPSGGGYSTHSNVSNTVRRLANPHFYAADLKISLYADGTWERVFPDGMLQRFYGEAEGDPMLSYRRGPHSPSIKFTIYDSRVQAYDALSKGRVDTILNPEVLTNEWLRLAARSDEINQYVSPQNGLAYLAFNLRRSPFDRAEFRQAVEVLLDRDRIVQQDLEEMVFPTYAIIPAANAFWHNPDIAPADATPSLQDRLDNAVQILLDAGWSWKVEPTWDAGIRVIVPGEGLRAPDGSPVPETSFIYPVPDDDLLMAAFGQEIAELLSALGVPLVPEPLGREAIINRVLIAGGSFDLYMLDWRFPLYPEYLCALFYSHNDTVLTGGYNTTGYNNPDFDSLCEQFAKEIDPWLAQEQAYRMQALLADDLPYIPLFHAQVVDMTRDHLIIPYLPALDGISGAGGMQTDMRVLVK